MPILSCSTENCTRPVKVKKRRLCGACYIRWQRAAGKVKTNPYARRCSVSFQTCQFCNELFAAKTRRTARACSKDECRRLLKNERQREFLASYRSEYGISYAHERYAEKREAYKQKRRLLTGANAEKFSNEEIFARDGWICQLCQEAVDPDLKFPHRQSKSLDHVIPVSRGGSHTRANVQLAHMSCNSSKNNKLLIPA